MKVDTNASNPFLLLVKKYIWFSSLNDIFIFATITGRFVKWKSYQTSIPFFSKFKQLIQIPKSISLHKRHAGIIQNLDNSNKKHVVDPLGINRAQLYRTFSSRPRFHIQPEWINSTSLSATLHHTQSQRKRSKQAAFLLAPTWQNGNNFVKNRSGFLPPSSPSSVFRGVHFWNSN